MYNVNQFLFIAADNNWEYVEVCVRDECKASMTAKTFKPTLILSSNFIKRAKRLKTLHQFNAQTKMRRE